MELVGAFSGGPWTDHPLCTPPALAHVARLVNDQTTAQDRPVLATLIPCLISPYDENREMQADVATGLAIFETAGRLVPAALARDLTRRFQQAEFDVVRHPRRLAAARQRHRILMITDQVIRAAQDAVALEFRDEMLWLLLIGAINAQRTAEHLSPLPATPPTPPPVAGSIVVLTHWERPLGADWHELDVALDPTSLPHWLTDAWQQQSSGPPKLPRTGAPTG